MRRQKPLWEKLASGLFVPPYLKFAPGYPCCCACMECVFCKNNRAPCSWEVTIDGIMESDTDACGSCDSFNDTYILEFDTTAPTHCAWQYDFDFPGICDREWITLQVFGAVVGPLISVKIETSSSNALGYWFQQTYGDLVECLTIVNEDLPAFYESVDPSPCDIFGSPDATCTVTAL